MSLCQMRGNALSEHRRHDPGDLFDAGGPQLRDAAEAPQQLLRRARTYPGNVFEPGLNGALGPALAMKSHGKAMCFVTYLLN